jgi:hypothetical protein
MAFECLTDSGNPLKILDLKVKIVLDALKYQLSAIGLWFPFQVFFSAVNIGRISSQFLGHCP